jgi:CheY-like chemotaxis protein
MMDAAPQRTRILVVEDDEIMRTYVVDLISSFGYSVTVASGAIEAMRLIDDDQDIALIFTDVNMPGVDGVMLADMVNQHRPDMKILYTTGGSGVAFMRQNAGILHGRILRKPYSSEALRNELRQLLPHA